jgi:hypothetical protein
LLEKNKLKQEDYPKELHEVIQKCIGIELLENHIHHIVGGCNLRAKFGANFAHSKSHDPDSAFRTDRWKNRSRSNYFCSLCLHQKLVFP